LGLAIAGGARERDRPGDAAPAGGHVLQPLSEEAQDLVAPDLGPHEVGMPLQQLLEEALVAGEAEEPVALLHLLEHARRMDAALPVHDLRAGLEGLAANAVQAAVAALIEIVGVAAEDPLDQVGDSRLVLRRGGADELV